MKKLCVTIVVAILTAGFLIAVVSGFNSLDQQQRASRIKAAVNQEEQRRQNQYRPTIIERGLNPQ